MITSRQATGWAALRGCRKFELIALCTAFVLLLASSFLSGAFAAPPATATFTAQVTPNNAPDVSFTFTVTSGSCTSSGVLTTPASLTCNVGSTYTVSGYPTTVPGPDSSSQWSLVTVTGNHGVINPNNPTLTFHYQQQYLVTFVVSPSGAGTTVPTGSGYYSGSLSISAAANAGYAFSSWSTDNPSGISFTSSTSSSTTAAISGSGTVTANFASIDSTPPTSSASVTSGTLGVDQWYTSSSVTVTIVAVDNAGGSGVASISYSLDGGSVVTAPGSSVDVVVSGDGTHTIQYYATDNAGNVESAQTFAVKIDSTPPVVTISPTPASPNGNNGWYVSPVSFAVSGTDATSGVASCSSIPTYSGPDGSSITVTATCTDNAGNVGDGSFAFNYDSTPPVVTIASPTGTTYVLDQSVLASYSCSDATSGVATCIGTVANGSNVPTGSVGTYAFTVTATDAAGNTNQETVTYKVQYNFGGFLQPVPAPVQTFKTGSTVPVKFQLTDASGSFISTAVASISVTGPNGAVTPTSNSNTGNLFRYDPTGNLYVYNLSTKGLTAGTYTITVALDDGTTHSVQIQLK